MPVWGALVCSAATVREGMWGANMGTGLSDQVCRFSDYIRTIGDIGACSYGGARTHQVWSQGEPRKGSTPHRCTATQACQISSAKDTSQSSAGPKDTTKGGPQDRTKGTQAGTQSSCKARPATGAEGWQKQWRSLGPAPGNLGRKHWACARPDMRVDITPGWEDLANACCDALSVLFSSWP